MALKVLKPLDHIASESLPFGLNQNSRRVCIAECTVMPGGLGHVFAALMADGGNAAHLSA